MFDCHCHLTDIAEPLTVLAEALNSGVGSVLSCGYDTQSNQAVRLLRRQLPSLPVAIGLHPWFARQDVAPVLSCIQSDPPTAVGEIGLDLWDHPPKCELSRQLQVLEAQLQVASSLKLPVTLHSRKALTQLDAVLRNHPRVRGVLHAFGGSREQASSLIARGHFIGVGGGITRIRAGRLRSVVQALPLEALLLETDAPAIGMDIVEPPDVRPKHIGRVAEVLAGLRGVHVDEVVACTDANAVRLFGDSFSPGAQRRLRDELARATAGSGSH